MAPARHARPWRALVKAENTAAHGQIDVISRVGAGGAGADVVTKAVHKQIRGFVIIWLAITFIMVMATFLAIYFTSGAERMDAASGNPIPLATAAEQSNAGPDPLPSASPQPSSTPTRSTPDPTMPVYLEEVTLEPTLTPIPTPWPVAVKRYEVGIQVEQSPDFNPENQDNWYRSVTADLGMRWVKQQVRWEQMEAQQGEIDWSVLDFIMPSAQKFDIKMLLSIVTAPAWAREPGASLDRHGPPADPQIFADFVAAILKRYPGQIHAIEVWNEQNLDREWTSIHGLSAEKYVELLRVAYQTIKAIEPGTIVISGALSPTGVDDGRSAVDDFKYMERQIEADMLDWADCVGAHHNGYNVSPDYRYLDIPDDPTAIFQGPFSNRHHSWSFRSTLEGYAQRIRAASRDTQLCVTEFGWPSSEDLGGARQGFEFSLDNTLAEQAEWITRAMTNMETWGFVWLAFFWNFNYGPQAGYAITNDNVPYSLIGPDFTFRPAYDAIRAWQQDYLARASS